MTELEEITELKSRIKELEKVNKFLSDKKDFYENGDAKLYHAVKRKMSEMATILNSNDLSDISLSDKDNKAFERVSSILEKCEKYAISASALGVRSGIEVTSVVSDKEYIPMVKKAFTPEMAADQVGELAGQNRQ